MHRYISSNRMMSIEGRILADTGLEATIHSQSCIVYETCANQKTLRQIHFRSSHDPRPLVIACDHVSNTLPLADCSTH